MSARQRDVGDCILTRCAGRDRFASYHFWGAVGGRHQHRPRVPAVILVGRGRWLNASGNDDPLITWLDVGKVGERELYEVLLAVARVDT